MKTEEFVVPVGTSVTIDGLAFDFSACAYDHRLELIVQQIFNSIEEITETRSTIPIKRRPVPQDEVRGASFLSHIGGDPGKDQEISAKCARAVVDRLRMLGTPPWRLIAKGHGRTRSTLRPTAVAVSERKVPVEFKRTK